MLLRLLLSEDMLRMRLASGPNKTRSITERAMASRPLRLDDWQHVEPTRLAGTCMERVI